MATDLIRRYSIKLWTMGDFDSSHEILAADALMVDPRNEQ